MRYRPVRCLIVCLTCTCVSALLLAYVIAPINDPDAMHLPPIIDEYQDPDQDDVSSKLEGDGIKMSNQSVFVRHGSLDNTAAPAPAGNSYAVIMQRTRPMIVSLSSPLKAKLASAGNFSRPRSRLLNVFERWNVSRRSFCGGRLHAYPSFALLSEASINHDRCRGAGAVGGEPVSSVLSQNESVELYTNFTGCFALPCRNDRNGSGITASTTMFSSARNQLDQWLNGLDRSVTNVDDVSQHIEKSFTVVITRFDYANMYFVVNDWYNVYLMARFFDKPPDTINVLLVDAHPRGLFDDTWSVIFGGAKQLYRLPPGRTLFAGGLVWGLMGAGPITKPNTYMERAPYIDDFHQFVVARHGLPDPDERLLDCNNVSVLFIWRHDYVAHPRNPNGTVTRKIANEDELIKFIAGRHRDVFRVRGLQLDSLPFVEQLRVVGETDVMIGMHGAGLSHVTFMPRHGALIELKPIRSGVNTHFADLALWRRLIYRSWSNNDTRNEVSKTATRIPVDVVNSLLVSTVDDMCAKNSTERRISAFDYHEQLTREEQERRRSVLKLLLVQQQQKQQQVLSMSSATVINSTTTQRRTNAQIRRRP